MKITSNFARIAIALALLRVVAPAQNLTPAPLILRTEGVQSDFPALALDGKGQPWIAFVAWDGKQDSLRIAKQDEKLQHIPIIVFTSSQHSADVENCYKLGANAFVVKPVAFDELLKTIQVLCDFWLRVNLEKAP